MTELVPKGHPPILVDDAFPRRHTTIPAPPDGRFWPTVDEMLPNLYRWTELTRRTALRRGRAVCSIYRGQTAATELATA